MDIQYTGYQIKQLSETELSKLYNNEYSAEGFKVNEYLIVEDAAHKIIDYFYFNGEKFQQVKYPVLGNDFTGQMKPRNPQQYCAMDLIKNPKIPIKLITGNFGSGKSMMCIVGALEALQKGLFDKIIFVRNNVQVKDTDQLGSLPGDMYDKTLPYLMPFADHCGGVKATY